MPMRPMWVVLYIRVPVRVPFIRVPYDVGDPKRGPEFRELPI